MGKEISAQMNQELKAEILQELEAILVEHWAEKEGKNQQVSTTDAESESQIT